MENLKGAALALAMALITNIELGRKALPGTNAGAFLFSSSVTKKKTFLKYDFRTVPTSKALVNMSGAPHYFTRKRRTRTEIFS